MSRGSRNHLGAVAALAVMATAPPVAAEADAPPGLPPIPEGPPESIHAEAVFVESDVVAENRQLRERLESQRVFFETRLQEQAEIFDASWAEREREIATQLQAPPFAEAMASLDRPRRAVFDASVPLTVAGKRVTYGPGDPVPPHIDPATLPVGAVRYLPEEG